MAEELKAGAAKDAATQILDLIMDECRYWHGRNEALRGNFAILYAKAKEIVDKSHGQGGEAVAWRVTGRDGLTVTAQYPEWAEADCLLTITPLYTHPADQVADDLTMVKVSRELLERIVKRGMRLPDETQHQHLEELRALLAKSEGMKK